MSASNYNYVCFECRTTTRHPKTSPKAPLCLNCGVECFNLGYKVEIPKRDNLKSWSELQAECERRGMELQDDLALRRTRRQHFLEQEISRMREMPDNRDRNRQIKKLEEQLANYHIRKTEE